jgi:hypothetical protein
MGNVGLIEIITSIVLDYNKFVVIPQALPSIPNTMTRFSVVGSSMLIFFAAMSGSLKAQLPNYVPAEGLLGWWPFNGNANDESGNGNNGVVNGAALATDRFGNLNSAYDFDGLNDHISLPSGAGSSLNVIGDMSISFWLKTAQTSNFALITFGDNTGQDGGFLLDNIISAAPNNNPDKVSFWTRDNWISSETIWNNDATSNICVTLANGIFSLYKDGIRDTLISNQPAVSSYSGNRYFGVSSLGTYFFDGILDDVGFWNRALTEEEIQQLYLANIAQGCTDISACNYNSEALIDDGSCIYALEFYDCNGICISDCNADGICDELEVSGCTYPNASNYNPNATDDDGSCNFACPGDLNNDGIINTSDLLLFLSFFGQNCP